jgi:integrase
MNKSTIRFLLRSDKISPDGLAPIDLVYQIRGDRQHYSTREKIRAINWHNGKKQQQAIYLDKKAADKLFPGTKWDLFLSSREVDQVNAKLSTIKSNIVVIERDFENDHKPYDVGMVIGKLKDQQTNTTKRQDPSSIIFDFIDHYIAEHENTREKGSLVVYNSLKNHLQGYEKAKKKRVTFDGIDYAFFQDFQNYLLSLRTPDGKPKLNNTTVAKQLSTIKTFLNYAKRQGVVVPDKYKDFKIKKESLEVIALTSEEFEKLFYMDLRGDKRLEGVRDVFCFSCATGLRYSDLAQLGREHIKRDEINLTVKKTHETLSVPLTPFSLSILEKYKGQARPLPVISNQKMNAYLKGWTERDPDTGEEKNHVGLCELAGIDDPVEIVRYHGSKRVAKVYPKYELVGVHTGRKTFATLCLEKGMSAEEVMAIGGWKSYTSFKRYVNITEKRKKVVMRNAWGEIKKSKLKAV